MTDTRQDTPEAIERLAEDCDARSCDGGSDPLLQDITVALRAYAQLLRQVDLLLEWSTSVTIFPNRDDVAAATEFHWKQQVNKLFFGAPVESKAMPK